MEENVLSLFGEDSELTASELNILSMRLWELLSHKTKLYAIDSSSVRAETAQELLSSICFLLYLYLKENALPVRYLLKAESLEPVYEAALKTGRQAFLRCKGLYQQACESVPQIENTSLSDTLRDIGQSFKTYDVYYFAHQVNCTIDYQLCHAVPESLSGTEYLCEYLRRLCMENHFLTHFSTKKVIQLLNAYCPDYKGLLINLYEPVFVNTLGLALLRQDIFPLNLTQTQKSEILELTSGLTEQQAHTLFHTAAESVCTTVEADAEEKTYAVQTAVALYPRFHAAAVHGSLDGVFCSW